MRGLRVVAATYFDRIIKRHDLVLYLRIAILVVH